MDNHARAFLFDLNGTMIDDMHYHLDVWFDVITKDLGSTLTKEEVRGHMYGTNHEVLTRIFGEGRFSRADVNAISQKKEARYQLVYKPYLDLLPGLLSFLKKAKQRHIAMAIGSAAPPFNIDFVLDNLQLRNYFPVIVSGDDVQQSKPHPEVFLKAANLLGVAPPSCIVFEDSPKGVEAAARAGMPCIVITTMHTKFEFSGYDNVLLFIKDYTDVRLSSLFADRE
jgi:beta-phosphoglucomutase family hydrolase